MKKQNCSIAMICLSLVGLIPLLLLPAGAQNTSLETSCDGVIDGWTLHSPDFGEIRFLGIQPLEGNERMNLEQRIKKELSSLVEGRKIRLEFDRPTEDSRGRLLAYLEVDQVNLNAWMLKNGYARASPILSDLKQRQLFQDMQKEAMEKKIGVWGLGAASYRENALTRERGKIIASKKSRYYYRPGQHYYDKVLPRHRVYFDTEEEARRAGFRPYLKD